MLACQPACPPAAASSTQLLRLAVLPASEYRSWPWSCDWQPSGGGACRVACRLLDSVPARLQAFPQHTSSHAPPSRQQLSRLPCLGAAVGCSVALGNTPAPVPGRLPLVDLHPGSRAASPRSRHVGTARTAAIQRRDAAALARAAAAAAAVAAAGWRRRFRAGAGEGVPACCAGANPVVSRLADQPLSQELPGVGGAARCA